MRARVAGVQVVDVAGRDERQLRLSGELDELRVDHLLHVEAGVLQLDVDVVAPEDLREPVELGAGVLGPVLLERLADAAGEAAGERDQPARVALEQLPVDARLGVVALEVAERAELDQVRVAGVRLGEQRQVRVAAGARLAVVGDVDLAADDRLDPLLPGGLVEVDRAGERAVVGERDGGHLELGGAGRERGDPARPVEDRVLAVDVQVDEVGAHGRAILGRASEGLPKAPLSRDLRRDTGTLEPAQEGESRPLRGRDGSEATLQRSCAVGIPRERIPTLRRKSEQFQVPAAREGVVLDPARLAPADRVRGRRGGGSHAHARCEPLREPLLFAACVERREVWVDPAIGHGCTRSATGASRSHRRRRSVTTTSRATRPRSPPSACGRGSRLRCDADSIDPSAQPPTKSR